MFFGSWYFLERENCFNDGKGLNEQQVLQEERP